MVRLMGAVLVSLALAVASPFTLDALAHSHPTVTMHVATGYGEQYRDTAWTPVRVTLHNTTANNRSGTLEIPDSLNNNNGQGFQGPPQAFTAQYETPVVLPAGATKQVTLYIPGSDIGGQVHVRFRSGSRILADSYTQPTSFGDSDASIGALVTDPANMTWLRHVSASLVTIHTIQLTPATLDPVAEALANFDIIVLTNTDTARLDADQMVALDRYVRNGGSLLLVGGPGWQSTLHSLPPTLLPGKLAGSRTLPNLSGLTSLGAGTPPRQPTIVSVLAHPTGKVVASERDVPLIVQKGVGSGQIVYLAFDPAVDPIAHWGSRSDLFTRIVSRAAPLAMSRAARPNGFQPVTPYMNSYGPPSDIASELANVPAAALPSILLFFFLTILYVVLLGPVNFFALRRLNRRELAWITVPATALLCVGATFGVAYHLKGNTVLLNTVSVVQLGGNSDQYPASLYVGLFAPVQGDYHLSYHAPALAAIRWACACRRVAIPT
jgi:hypothetical protein